MGEAWDPSKKQCSFANRGHWVESTFNQAFGGLINSKVTMAELLQYTYFHS